MKKRKSPPRRDVMDRFWEKVRKIKGRNRCWEWIAAIDQWGYGRFGVCAGRVEQAHRFLFEVTHGVKLGSSLALHTCDNARCVRPSHVYIGTTQDNSNDAVRRNRVARGQRVAGAKLTTDKVRRMRAERARGAKLAELGARYGVTDSNVAYVCSRASWKHVS